MCTETVRRSVESHPQTAIIAGFSPQCTVNMTADLALPETVTLSGASLEAKCQILADSGPLEAKEPGQFVQQLPPSFVGSGEPTSTPYIHHAW